MAAELGGEKKEVVGSAALGMVAAVVVAAARDVVVREARLLRLLLRIGGRSLVLVLWSGTAGNTKRRQ